MSQLELSTSDGKVTITGYDELDLTNVQELEKLLAEGALSDKQPTLDLRTASYIDSTIVKAFIKKAIDLFSQQGRLRVLLSRNTQPETVLSMISIGDMIDLVVEG